MSEYSIGEAIHKFLQRSHLKNGVRAIQIEEIWEKLMGKTIAQWRWQEVLALVSGAVIAAFIRLASPTSIEPTTLIIFGAGSIAICAMILPGISGSFILLLMGLYEPVLGAVRSGDIVLLGTFAAGAGLGLMLFSRVLSWLLHHYEHTLMALLTGFMAGSLVKVWPWKETITWYTHKGIEKPLLQENILPPAMDMSEVYALLFALAGFGGSPKIRPLRQRRAQWPYLLRAAF